MKADLILHDDCLEIFEALPTNSARGALILALLRYSAAGTVPDFSADPLLNMAFISIARRYDRENEHYKEVCRKRAEGRRHQAEEAKRGKSDYSKLIDLKLTK